MIKVLHVVGTMNLGGQETFIMNMYRGIDREEVNFDFLCMGHGEFYYSSEIKSLGGRLHRLEGGRFKRSVIARMLTRKRKVKKFLLQNKYDIVHIHTNHASSYLVAKGAIEAGIKKVLLHSHNSNMDYGHRSHHFFKKRLARLDVIRLACSTEAAEWMFGDDTAKIIYNGINLDEFSFNKEKRCEKRRELGFEDSFVIGHVGRFSEQKNHRFLINVFSEYLKIFQDARLCLVGDGELKSECEGLIKDLNIEQSVNFLGLRSDVKELLNAFDVFLFPSLYEGLPVIGVEAQVNGVPVVASDVVSKQMIINDRVKQVSLAAPVLTWTDAIEEARCLDRSSFEKLDNFYNFDMSTTRRILNDLYREVE